jgi:AraC-like DNA-binding protein
VLARIGRPLDRDVLGDTARRIITRQGGRVSIEQMARSHGLTRQQFASRFSTVAGLTPKLFARITRFQALVHALLSTDVSRWATLSSAAGFYDQAHMINEFKAFAGAPPSSFFKPHDI